ncbi:uncharacterized protein DUF2029 [Homoserinimonas aerilata]|uniref:Uncharacterized protein DUF2029 n=1 Tax=Homoserinimonas aerilata TaxID=1162970 RepID=A0A542YKC6_9MICO|nr:glycosyltransferase 87 family protein [Homoserinimonas aerilata]TQL48557.1 uncharacterized protein DUF2029 [Homoserinimonas aerilata]
MTRTTLRTPGRRWLWPAFLAVNVWLCWVAYAGPGYALGDVYLYRWWVELGLSGGPWVGIDTAWVYPVLALAPLVAAAVAGIDGYVLSWLMLVVLLNGVALAAVTGWTGRARNLGAGWWWAVFLLLLGPIAVGRVDSITAPLAVIAVALLAKHPVVAGILLAAATWIKVWPAALIAAVLVVSRDRWRMLAGTIAASVAVVCGSLALGGANSLLSFVTQQAGRGLQIEAPVSAPWLWMGVGGVPGTGLYYDDGILTYQVRGDGVDIVAQLMTPLLALVAVAIAVLAVWLLGRGAKPAALLPPFALALVTALIAVNKVGSPQFVAWLAAPIVLGLVAHAAGRASSFRVPALIVAVIAGLTQAVYPYLYGYLLNLDPVILSVLTARNVLEFVLLAWSVRAMVTAPRGRRGGA